MRRLMWVGIFCLLTTPAFPQRQGGGGGHVGGGTSVAHRGSGGGHRGYSNGGHRGSGGLRYGHRGYRGFYSPWWGYGAYWPLYWGDSGLWDYSSYYDGGYYDSAPNVTVVTPPPQPAYPVVISQPIQTAQPVVHEYRTQEDYGLPAERQTGPILYLIAFRDHVIRAALAYWVQGNTLHYLDTDHKEGQAPLSAVDPEFSAQLNRERHIPFSLDRR